MMYHAFDLAAAAWGCTVQGRTWRWVDSGFFLVSWLEVASPHSSCQWYLAGMWVRSNTIWPHRLPLEGSTLGLFPFQ